MATESSSRSISLTGAASLVQQLKIEGFSATASMALHQFIASRWTVDGYECEVRIYPATTCIVIRGHRTTWVALELIFVSESRTGGSRVSMGCRLVDPSGKLQPSEEHKVSVSKKFCHPNESSGLLFLQNRNDLAASGYLVGDCLALECTITVLKELPVPTIPATKEVVEPPSTNLHQHLGELLQNGTGADVTFLVSGESFAAHKNILAARSPVFMAEFFGHMKEKSSRRVEIENMEAPVFKALLHFIYTDKVPEELDQQKPDIVGACTMAQHLLAAADRYGLDRLKLLCEIKLSAGITVDTAATTLALAEQHDCEQLKAKCMEFIVSTPAVLDAVLATEGYKHLEMSCPSVLTGILKSTRGRKN
ncbi:BTB/POZ and MATH domain-containing protein 2 [Brachypodium distachyon]|uniref:BTB domain-containing protein n=1 Tax=Brachypodium distachyon TaxID=15368 RepID=I1GW06_BRADI|nr:BTB/POZ and MATH domain-containing protein 2 [Brachypodium distachyon]KQK17057.1 hypothetical protein BRADI_1g32247v3 [Brachypodium distachyon]|eukprot:XP_003560433.1 BTB/POZ and MATH domain-containing protein 2 [Brachypodium distachyon]